MIHDAGAKDGRLARMHRRFPTAELVVFGHSHIPLDAADDRLRILNPGSPTDKRRQPHRTLAELTSRRPAGVGPDHRAPLTLRTRNRHVLVPPLHAEKR